MNGLSADAFRLIYGFTYVIMGLAVGIRAIAFPSSSFRNRLLALAGFGILHAAALWGVDFIDRLGDAAPSYGHTLAYLPSDLALFYFAFGWNERRPMLAHLVVAASVGIFAITAILTEGEVPLQIVSRIIIDFPATLSAALVFARDDTFRGASRFAERTRWIAAAGFAIYAALQFFPPQADLFPATILNATNFETVAGVSVNTARAFAILIITIGTLALLNHFDFVMRRQTEAALESVDGRLKKALEITGLGIWEWDIKKDVAHWSDQMYAIFGYARGGVVPNYSLFIEHVHP